MSSKNPNIRRKSALYLAIILEKYPKSTYEGARMFEHIEQALTLAVHDASMEARAAGRKGFLAYKAKFYERADRLVSKFDWSVKKAIADVKVEIKPDISSIIDRSKNKNPNIRLNAFEKLLHCIKNEDSKHLDSALISSTLVEHINDKNSKVSSVVFQILQYLIEEKPEEMATSLERVISKLVECLGESPNSEETYKTLSVIKDVYMPEDILNLLIQFPMDYMSEDGRFFEYFFDLLETSDEFLRHAVNAQAVIQIMSPHLENPFVAKIIESCYLVNPKASLPAIRNSPQRENLEDLIFNNAKLPIEEPDHSIESFQDIQTSAVASQTRDSETQVEEILANCSNNEKESEESIQKLIELGNSFEILLKLIDLLRSAEPPVIQVIIRIISKGIKHLKYEDLVSLLGDLCEELKRNINHENPEVRRSVVFCFVELQIIAGQKIDSFLSDLNENQQKLVHVYFQRKISGGKM